MCCNIIACVTVHVSKFLAVSHLGQLTFIIFWCFTFMNCENGIRFFTPTYTYRKIHPYVYVIIISFSEHYICMPLGIHFGCMLVYIHFVYQLFDSGWNTAQSLVSLSKGICAETNNPLCQAACFVCEGMHWKWKLCSACICCRHTHLLSSLQCELYCICSKKG